MKRRRSRQPVHQAGSAFAGFRFPPDVIVLAVRWFLRFGLSYRASGNSLPSAGSEPITSAEAEALTQSGFAMPGSRDGGG